MNPRVSEMLTAKNRQDLEIAMLEELLTGDVKCEVTHTKTVCSHEVTHYYSSCTGEWRACWNSIKPKIEALHRMSICSGCEKDPLECWTITPI